MRAGKAGSGMEERKKRTDRVRRHFGGTFFSEMTVLYGNLRASVHGCRRILSYDPNEIRLALRDRELILRGGKLRCVSFTGGCVTVEGILTAVEFSERRERP